MLTCPTLILALSRSDKTVAIRWVSRVCILLFCNARYPLIGSASNTETTMMNIFQPFLIILQFLNEHTLFRTINSMRIYSFMNE